jgi:cysteine desulfurase
VTIYLDHAASTPVHPAALEAMLPYLTAHFANPSGSHSGARRARRAIDDARDVVAADLGCEPGEVVFTGSGTEADNLAVLGVAASRPGRVLVSALEHPAVRFSGAAVGATTIPARRDGLVDLAALEDELDPSVVLVSVMCVNHELGTIQPLADVVALVRAHAPEALVHTDAVQALHLTELSVLAAGADLISVSAHKCGGPKGVGALVVRAGARGRLQAVLHGGPQEHELRPGTENVAGIVGFAAALEASRATRASDVARIARLRDHLADGLVETVPGLVEHGRRGDKVASHCHIEIQGVEIEELLFLLDAAGIAASAGASCASGAIEPSPVLLAIGLDARAARSCLRLTLGTTTTAEEVDEVLELLPSLVSKLRRDD